MNTLENILEVRLGDEIFGLNADEVEQILVIPAITPIPLSDKSLLGVAILSGKIMHAIDVGLAIGKDGVNLENENARLLTLSCKDCFEAFVVDEVLGMIQVDEQNLEEIGDSESFLEAFYKMQDHVVQVLSIDVLLKKVNIEAFQPIQLDSLQEENSKNEIKNSSDDSFQRALFFKVENEKFAIDIELLKELTFTPKEITPIAGSDALGMITLRDEVITLLDMNGLLGFSYKEPDEKSRVLIVNYKGKSIALLVDEVEEVKNLDNSALETMPGGVAAESIAYVYKQKDAITSILSTDYMRELTKEYYIENEESSEQKLEDGKGGDMSEVAVFKIADEEYAFDIEEVQEIIRYDTITPVPEAPGYMEGILNLRGSVIPIISLPSRLGFGFDVTDKTKIVVCSVGDEKIGFIVDDVNEILFVEDAYISKAVSEEALFEEVINLDDGKRVILKIKVDNLLDEETLENIKMMEK